MSEQIIDTSPVSACVRLQFLDYRIDIETNSLRVARKVAQYFDQYLVQHDAAAAHARLFAIAGEPSYDALRLEVWSKASSPNRTPKESYYDEAGVRYILKNRTGVLIALGVRDASITGALDANINQVVNLVGTMFGLSLLSRGYAMLHASAVVRAGTEDATIFMGNSGSGKSSLALQMIERGPYEYLSNDRVLLRVTEGGVHLVGLPKKPRVNPGTLLASKVLARTVPEPKLQAYERLSPGDLWTLEEKHDVDVGEAFGVRTRLTAALKQAYSLEWRPSGTGLESRRLDAADALAAMRVTAKDFGPYDMSGPPDMAPEFSRIAVCVPMTAIAGKADPSGFAAMLVSGEG